MDIVSLSPRPRSTKQRQPRRHTTEVRLEELPKCTVEELGSNTTAFSAINHKSTSSQDDRDQDAFTGLAKSELTASWHTLENSDVEGCGAESGYHESSQVDILQEMKSHPLHNYLEVHKHGYQLSYELALDNMLTPFVSPTSQPKPTTYTEHVIKEIITTEKTYVGDLADIVEGYIIPLESRVETLQINSNDLDDLFGNVREIKSFNRSFLDTLKVCGENCKTVGQCFQEKAEDFKTHYRRYCNNYPKSIQVLSRLQKDNSLSRFLKICQERLNHMLPLGAYLLKPVQRVLKYSLLLGQLVKNMSVDDVGFTEASFALDKMTSVSQHINEMKKRYDAEIHIQGLQSLIRGLEDVDLTKAGDLVLEESLRLGGRIAVPSIRTRSDRTVYTFLFRKLLLMTKKEDDGFQYRAHLEIRDIQLTERVEKEPNCFQVRQVSTGNYYTLQAPSYKGKENWVHKIKTLLMESIPGLPDKAKMLIMAGFPTDFGDTAKRSPKTPHRQRHSSDKTPSSPRRDKRNVSRQTKTSSNSFQQSRTKPRNRSSTSPSLLAGKLVQASLVATLQLEPFQEKSTTETKFLCADNQSSEAHDVYEETEPRKVFMESLPTLTVTSPKDDMSGSEDQLTSCGVEIVEKQHADTRMQISLQNMNDVPDEKPILQTKGKDLGMIPFTQIDSLDLADDETLESKSSLQNPLPICSNLPLVHNIEPDHVKNPSETFSSAFTDDHENLFNDLMCEGADNKSLPSLSTSLDQTEIQTLQCILHAPQESISEPDDADSIAKTPQLAPPLQFATAVTTKTTPKVTPNLIQHENVIQSNMVSDENDIMIPQILTPLTDSRDVSCNELRVARRHSFTSQHKNEIIHRREESRSTGNSPETTHKDSCIPPTFKHNPMTKLGGNSVTERFSPRNAEKVWSEYSHNTRPCETSSTTGKLTHGFEESEHIPPPFSDDCITSETTHVPFGGNLNEELSFDEVLQSYDHYASATGITTRTKPKARNIPFGSPNISINKKRKKDRRRSMTVATIDAATVSAAKEAMISAVSSTPEPSRRRVSKVQQLAREYSRRIKDHQKGHWLKRFSTVTEEAPDEDSLSDKPDWLVLLQKKKSTESNHEEQSNKKSDIDVRKTRSLARLESEQSSMALMEESDLHSIPHSHSTDFDLDRVATPDPVELHKKGGLRGWVKSIVVKFGGNK